MHRDFVATAPVHGQQAAHGGGAYRAVGRLASSGIGVRGRCCSRRWLDDVVVVVVVRVVLLWLLAGIVGIAALRGQYLVMVVQVVMAQGVVAGQWLWLLLLLLGHEDNRSGHALLR